MPSFSRRNKPAMSAARRVGHIIHRRHDAMPKSPPHITITTADARVLAASSPRADFTFDITTATIGFLSGHAFRRA